MSKRYHHSLENQAQVKVIAQARDAAPARAWFVTLAAVFASVFYFWGYYYFWAYLWRVLTGG